MRSSIFVLLAVLTFSITSQASDITLLQDKIRCMASGTPAGEFYTLEKVLSVTPVQSTSYKVVLNKIVEVGVNINSLENESLATAQVRINSGPEPQILITVSRSFIPGSPAQGRRFLNLNIPGVATLDCTR